MSTPHLTNGTGPAPAHPTPEQLEADIARQRDELADTVSALQAKLDVKARARHGVAELRSRLTTSAGRPRPELVAAAAAVVVVTVAVVIVRQRR